MLNTDARSRITASELIKDPFISCEDIRLTAFETSGSLFRAQQLEHIKKYGRSGVPFSKANYGKE